MGIYGAGRPQRGPSVTCLRGVTSWACSCVASDVASSGTSYKRAQITSVRMSQGQRHYPPQTSPLSSP